MENVIKVNIDNLDSNFISNMKKKFKHKFLEIRILDDDEYLASSENMKNRINEARTRKDGLSIEEVIEKYNI